MKLLVSTVALALGLAAASVAQDSHKGHQDHMDTGAMQEFELPPECLPNENHERLNHFVGTWNVTNRMWMEPGAEPMESTASTNVKWVLDGRFLMEEYKGDMMGTPFTGLGISGFDNHEGKYTSLWMDSMGTAVMKSTGSVDSSGKVFTYHGSYWDPWSKMDTNCKFVLKITGKDSHTFTMYVLMPDGSEFKTMEMTYTRA